ncbi:efflux RND transporter periplasmic adaptor subunit [Oceanobacillus halotolerans]|uniref:efflux RND transporter periplasmic adaptor subunit n=1 Tax=Oceanobacillus halotolerans TaxID=2663380 RepID=UPI0013DD5152|nr:efflux RND transporter periplasmic adaptor subunit [Oceanobacillus halotolerans]
MKKWIIGITLLSLLVLAACNQEEDANEEEAEPVIPVETEEVTVSDLIIQKSVYGRTAPNTATPIMVQTPGEVDTLEVENGDIIEEDDVIATIQTAAGNQTIYAPEDGEIINLTAEEGAMATSEEPLAVIADLDTMKLQFSVTAGVRDLFEKEAIHKVVIGENEYEAEITTIDKMPDDTGLYPVEATIDNEEGDVLPGMVAELTVPESRVTDAIIVPTEAIVEESDETFVYVIEDDVANKAAVTITETQSDKTAIEGDTIAEGDQVVTNGQLTLSDQSKVNVTEEGNES